MNFGQGRNEAVAPIPGTTGISQSILRTASMVSTSGGLKVMDDES